MQVTLDTSSLADYALFLQIKSLPRYRFVGRTAWFPDEYSSRLGIAPASQASTAEYTPLPSLFDYQRDIARLAVRKRKFAAFVEPGYGKTLIMTEWARHAAQSLGGERSVLMLSPPMVIPQVLSECQRFYGDSMPVRRIRAAELPNWAANGTGIGITNWEALTDKVPQGRIGAIAADEASCIKSAYGTWGQELIRLGKGLDWKLCLTGTPAPNDRVEFASYAVFLDVFPTINSFMAKYFVNKGQTSERWIIKPHALEPFYRDLSHWSIFLSNPSTYGWRDNAGTIPPILVHIHDVELTDDQNEKIRELTGSLFATTAGGITNRSKLARIAKGGDSLKPAFIKSLIESWPDESTLVWCKYNEEQDHLAKYLPNSASITGTTPEHERERIIADFQAGKVKTLISKSRILGVGMNLQIATRQIFSTCHDSFEEYFQAVKRSNRVGSTRPLNVHLPITDAERPMLENVLEKADRVQADTDEQERIFKEFGHVEF